ncbi:hypothetical protein DFH08DRAFT_814716 [Mycena albidolilacea]|uniref:Helicase C-terminal domain-containing protein n=1 Tax=Mycena albidolilacea TaxID=1033008 RepID=A0AAD7EL47_9AGAR|nr:hypothetical protein DFH08DRAFT_814716 [Mycena albidolilacea]
MSQRRRMNGSLPQSVISFRSGVDGTLAASNSILARGKAKSTQQGRKRGRPAKRRRVVADSDSDSDASGDEGEEKDTKPADEATDADIDTIAFPQPALVTGGKLKDYQLQGLQWMVGLHQPLRASVGFWRTRWDSARRVHVFLFLFLSSIYAELTRYCATDPPNDRLCGTPAPRARAPSSSFWSEVLEGGCSAARDAARVDCGWNRDVFILLCNRGVGESGRGVRPACSLFHLFFILHWVGVSGVEERCQGAGRERAPSVECVVRWIELRFVCPAGWGGVGSSVEDETYDELGYWGAEKTYLRSPDSLSCAAFYAADDLPAHPGLAFDAMGDWSVSQEGRASLFRVMSSRTVQGASDRPSGYCVAAMMDCGAASAGPCRASALRYSRLRSRAFGGRRMSCLPSRSSALTLAWIPVLTHHGTSAERAEIRRTTLALPEDWPPKDTASTPAPAPAKGKDRGNVRVRGRGRGRGRGAAALDGDGFGAATACVPRARRVEASEEEAEGEVEAGTKRRRVAESEDEAEAEAEEGEEAASDIFSDVEAFQEWRVAFSYCSASLPHRVLSPPFPATRHGVAAPPSSGHPRHPRPFPVPFPPADPIPAVFAEKDEVDVSGAYSTYTFFPFLLGVMERDGYPDCARCGMRLRALFFRQRRATSYTRDRARASGRLTPVLSGRMRAWVAGGGGDARGMGKMPRDAEEEKEEPQRAAEASARKGAVRKVCSHPFPFARPDDDSWSLGRAPPTPALLAAREAELLGASGKILLLDRLLGELFCRGHKVLLFSQFTTMLDIIEDWVVGTKGWRICRIDGTTPPLERRDQMEVFQSAGDAPDAPRLFLLSTRSGLGAFVGLLDCVSFPLPYIFLARPSSPCFSRFPSLSGFPYPPSPLSVASLPSLSSSPLSPSIQPPSLLSFSSRTMIVTLTEPHRTHKWTQAQDRAHRFGQTKPVLIFRLVSAHTIEEKIMQRAAEKRELEALVIAKGKFKMPAADVGAGKRAIMAEMAADLLRLEGEQIDVLERHGPRRAARPLGRGWRSSAKGNRQAAFAVFEPPPDVGNDALAGMMGEEAGEAEV